MHGRREIGSDCDLDLVGKSAAGGAADCMRGGFCTALSSGSVIPSNRWTSST